jgi:hypothetical protein
VSINIGHFIEDCRIFSGEAHARGWGFRHILCLNIYQQYLAHKFSGHVLLPVGFSGVENRMGTRNRCCVRHDHNFDGKLFGVLLSPGSLKARIFGVYCVHNCDSGISSSR